MKNKKLWITLGVVALVVIILISSIVGSYNGFVEKQTAVESQFAQVQNVLQRRSDLIPNLVNTVKGYTAHENEVYTAISDARAKLAGANTVEEATEANSALDSALSRLLVIVENYPDLKANQNFIGLQDELAGSESRIAKERKNYNEAVQDYNASIRKFPKSIIAGLFGFDKADFFEADANAQDAPEVSFD